MTNTVQLAQTNYKREDVAPQCHSHVLNTSMKLSKTITPKKLHIRMLANPSLTINFVFDHLLASAVRAKSNLPLDRTFIVNNR
ncbi:hypothetical protein PoB_000456600 [Plakobranchus ocellatus]|uniref:Uncharacterized protein n=1 Tax=Plakobranchus ocellatus TaxID=259542 RepID=A0AAV3Y4C6_9GAST|nr:hypothetical protein PoB_000456600 [Plakobranchus ocellatus]